MKVLILLSVLLFGSTVGLMAEDHSDRVGAPTLAPGPSNGPAPATTQLAAFYAMVGRVFQESDSARVQTFFVADIQGPQGHTRDHNQQGWYKYSVTVQGYFKISADSASSAGAGLHHFMRHILNNSVTWGTNRSGWNVHPLSYWVSRGGFPQHETGASSKSHGAASPRDEQEEATSLGAYRYYLNVCTLGYTMAFWGWEEWEQHLDWMALHGINLPLASVGSEYVWWKTWTRPEFNLTTAEVLEYFTGPAFFPWLRMGNIHTWAGPVSLHFLENRMQLQKKLLKRMSEFGMNPILPAFDGHVPGALQSKFPDATMTKSPSWLGKPERAYSANMLVDPTDSLFPQIAKAFMNELHSAYGTSDFYNADTWNEMTPINSSQTYLRESSAAVYKGLTIDNPRATWVMQGWLFVSDEAFWTPDRIQAYLGGSPPDGLIILDLTSDLYPQFERTHGYFGYHWIWCMLHNYGGRRGIYGNMSDISIRPVTDYNQYSSMVGTGLTMEAIDQNLIIYELLLEMAWRGGSIPPQQQHRVEWEKTTKSSGMRLMHHRGEVASPTSGSMTRAQLDDWITVYCNARYYHATPGGNTSSLVSIRSMGVDPSLNTKLFQPLLVGKGPMTMMIPCCWFFTTLIGQPWFENGGRAFTGYDPDPLFLSFQAVLQDYDKSHSRFQSLMDSSLGATYRYDAIDFIRQFVSNIFTDAQRMLYPLLNSTGTTISEVEQLEVFMLDIVAQLDVLMGADENFLLGRWVQMARHLSHPDDPIEMSNLEFNAKVQVTTWGPNGVVSDYAGKPWNGLLQYYHHPRWSYLFAKTKEAFLTVNETNATSPDGQQRQGAANFTLLNMTSYDLRRYKEVDYPFATNYSQETGSGAGQFSMDPTLSLGVIQTLKAVKHWLDAEGGDPTVHHNVLMEEEGFILLPHAWHSVATPVPASMCRMMQPRCWAWDSNGRLYGTKPKGRVGMPGSGNLTVWEL